MSFKSPGRVILLSSTGQIVIGQFKEWRFQTLRPVREVRDNLMIDCISQTAIKVTSMEKLSKELLF